MNIKEFVNIFTDEVCDNVNGVVIYENGCDFEMEIKTGFREPTVKMRFDNNELMEKDEIFEHLDKMCEVTE